MTLIHCPESDSSGRVHAVAPSSAKASSVSYAWSLPDPRRYRSRFLPMRWPDLVLDDWAFRRWRSKEKEGNSKAVVDEVSGRVEGIEEGEGVQWAPLTRSASGPAKIDHVSEMTI